MRVNETVGRDRQSAEAVAEDDLFEMANLFPRSTGLPMTLWVSPRGGARHDVRVKVNMTHGNQMDVGNAAVVGLRPTPHVIAGELAPGDAQAVAAWVSLNLATLLDDGNGEIDTLHMAQRLRKLT
jgi:hypothetical protein